MDGQTYFVLDLHSEPLQCTLGGVKKYKEACKSQMDMYVLLRCIATNVHCSSSLWWSKKIMCFSVSLICVCVL